MKEKLSFRNEIKKRSESFDSYEALMEEDEAEYQSVKWERCSSIYNDFLIFFKQNNEQQENLYNQRAFDRLGKLLYSFLPDTFDDGDL